MKWKNVTKALWGVPYKYGDDENQQVLYRQVEDKNADYNCQKEPKFNSTSIVYNINMHFVES